MKYRVTIETERQDNEKYPSHDEIYQQTLEDLHVEAIVSFLNASDSKVERVGSGETADKRTLGVSRASSEQDKADTL